MIEITDKSRCTGCGGCKNVCPTQAITMKLDEEGFLYPYIDPEKCIHCNRCDAVCHMTKKLDRGEKPYEVYAACGKDAKGLEEVSSGGVFWALAEEMIDRGGIVYGVVMDSQCRVYHARAVTLEECGRFRRSKYLESNTGDCFTQVKKDLSDGKEVLFSGVGCQVAGLRSFLENADTKRLITCEVVCHGVPSRKAFEGYLKEIEKEKNSKVVSINYRDKSQGWSRNQICIKFEDGQVICEQSSRNLLHGNYIKGYFSRPSCKTCGYASIPRAADITCADYWRYTGELTKSNADKGISLVLCNNDKGDVFFRQAAEKRLLFEKSSLEKAVASCRHLAHTPQESPKRALFFKLLNKKGYKKAITTCSKLSLKARMRYKWQGVKNKLKRM